jgi:hypothetical protein
MPCHQAFFNGEPCLTKDLRPGPQQDFISTDLKYARLHIATLSSKLSQADNCPL